VRLLLDAGAHSTALLDHHDAFRLACSSQHIGVVRLLLDSQQPPTAAEVKRALNQQASEFRGEVAAQLLLFLWQVDDHAQAAKALIDFVGALRDPTAVGSAVPLLKGWAAETAAVEAEHARLVGQEQQTAVMCQDVWGMLVGFGFMQQQQQQQQ
jgi:hypothetical protein